MTSQQSAHKMNIHSMLKEKVRTCGEREFFYFEEQSFTYGDLDRESDKVASGLQSWALAKVIRWPFSWITGLNFFFSGSG